VTTDLFLQADYEKVKKERMEGMKTSMLYLAEATLMEHFRSTHFVNEFPDTKHDVRFFFIEGFDDEPATVYMVKAVMKPDEREHTPEFGFQQDHFQRLKFWVKEYEQRTGNHCIGRVYFFIKSIEMWRYADTEFVDYAGRAFDGGEIHEGGTIFLPVHLTLPYGDYPDDPYSALRKEYTESREKQTSIDWFNMRDAEHINGSD